MNIEVVENSKSHFDVMVDSVTIAEILRVYLSENGSSFVAWRREHPSKPVVFRIEDSSGVSKVVKSAISTIKKDCDKLKALVKK